MREVSLPDQPAEARARMLALVLSELAHQRPQPSSREFEHQFQEAPARAT